jgi:hypothetical protein
MFDGDTLHYINFVKWPQLPALMLHAKYHEDIAP